MVERAHIPVHIMGLAHIPVDRRSTRCAYTMKVYNLCRMLRSLGYRVILYGLEGSDTSVANEFVQCVSAEAWQAAYGKHDTVRYQFDWDTKDVCWQEFHRQAKFEIPRHFTSPEPMKPELVLCPFGWGHRPCTEKLPDNGVVIEPGIGYRDSFANFRVFESHALYHTTLGRANPTKVVFGKAYWTVIPNYIDPAEFEYREQKGDYFLYMGRLNSDKGISIALDTCERLGVKLVCVGQLPNPPGGKGATDIRREIAKAGALYIPSVGPDERRELLAGARAVFVPTQYVEPFGGVHIEANASGTPVITSDWGVFSETVLQGVTGYRCKTLREYMWAARHVDALSSRDCHEWAINNFSLAAVAPRYDAYFRRVYDLHTGKDWHYVPSNPEDSGELLTMVRRYPRGVLATAEDGVA